jgi:hypothetical protein
MEGRPMLVERGERLKMIRRVLFYVLFLLAVIAPARGAEKPAKAKAVPTPLREEPLDKLEAAAIADLPLGICVWTEELFQLAAPYLRAGDHLLIGTSQLAIVDRAAQGIHKTLLLPRRHELAETAAYQRAIRAVDALGMDDTPDLEQVQWVRRMADKYGKKTLLLPTGEDAQRLGAEMAPYADIFLIQSQRWLVEDRSPELRLYCDKVHAVANRLRQANPKLQIWIQVGRKLEYGGGNAGLFAHAFARLRATHPEDLAHGQVFISKAPDTQPGHGRQALQEFLAAVRNQAD